MLYIQDRCPIQLLALVVHMTLSLVCVCVRACVYCVRVFDLNALHFRPEPDTTPPTPPTPCLTQAKPYMNTWESAAIGDSEQLYTHGVVWEKPPRR